MMRGFLPVFFFAFASSLISPLEAMGQEPEFSRKEVIYGRKFGTALTMDVFQPKSIDPQAKGRGGAIIFAVSEGWYSNHAAIDANIPVYVKPYIAKGFTVFAVCHGGNPKYSLPEILEDMHRSVRFIRFHAGEYGIDPERIGMTGDSAGGYLSLIQACASQDGNPKAEDPVDRQSSRIQAAVAYFPPTDFLNWGVKGKKMLGDHPTVPVQGAFDFHKADSDTGALRLITDPKEREDIGKKVSPITHAHKGSAPTLIVHGDSDKLIPHQQSEIMAAKLKESGATCELIIMKGGDHDEVLVKAHIGKAVDWFERYLGKKN